MSLPGFTAEAACYRGGGGYRSSGRPGGASAGDARVIPATSCFYGAANLINRCVQRVCGPVPRTGPIPRERGDCVDRCFQMGITYEAGCNGATNIIDQFSNWDFWKK